MSWTGFTSTDFAAFDIPGLPERMEAIRERIQPKFHDVWTELRGELEPLAGRELYLHVARHARRTVNPPQDTWMAISHHPRGYKQHPHFQFGLWEDRLFIWFALIYEVPDKTRLAARLLKQRKAVAQAAAGHPFDLSTDHMDKQSAAFTAAGLKRALERFRDVKSAELLIGRQIPSGDPLCGQREALVETILDTYRALMPVYRLCLD